VLAGAVGGEDEDDIPVTVKAGWRFDTATVEMEEGADTVDKMAGRSAVACAEVVTAESMRVAGFG